MLETWLIEIVKAIGKIFLHPLLHWTIILYLLISYRRIKRERRQFGIKINRYFAEGIGTVGSAILFSIVISLVTVAIGIVLSQEAVFLLTMMLFFFSLTLSTSFLSASYTISLTFIALYLLSYVQIDFIAQYGLHFDKTESPLISLAVLTGIFLLIEAYYLRANKKGWRFPQLTLSNRGIWIGQHQLKKLAFIPFLVFIPQEESSGLLPILPYIELANESYSLLLIPFYLGYKYTVQSELPETASRRLATRTFIVGLLVLLLAVGSMYYFYLALAAVILAMLGKEWIMYRHRVHEQRKRAFFTPLTEGMRVLAILPDSSAQRLGISVGETIVKVNGKPVNNSNEFYEALQNSGAFVKLDVLDHNGELRFIRSAFYEVDHYKLGLLFAQKEK